MKPCVSITVSKYGTVAQSQWYQLKEVPTYFMNFKLSSKSQGKEEKEKKEEGEKVWANNHFQNLLPLVLLAWISLGYEAPALTYLGQRGR